ncbi:MAG: hypothetical protein RBU37_18535 [Myxococcota bacterium]|jgi:hypothetical protein|nr:hypothetical protein [Myxococcota bacterium]
MLQRTCLLGCLLISLAIVSEASATTPKTDPMQDWEDPPRPDPSSLSAPLDASLFQRPDRTYPMWTDNLDRFHFSLSAELGFSPPSEDDSLARIQTRLVAEMVSPLSRDYREHDHLLSLYFLITDYASTSLTANRHDHSQWGFLAPGIQLDSRYLGARIAIKGGTLHDDLVTILTPIFALRVGEPGSIMAVAQSHFGGLWAWSNSPASQSFFDNLELRFELELPVHSHVYLQLRTCFRDWLPYSEASQDYIHSQELYAVLGAELSGNWFQRSMPGFLGVGVRSVLESDAELYSEEFSEPEGLSIFVLLEADLGLYGGDSTLW